jgi:hypothetical protein
MMKLILGLLLVFGAVGGMDADPQGINIAAQMSIAMLGLFLMFLGTRKIR